MSRGFSAHLVFYYFPVFLPPSPQIKLKALKLASVTCDQTSYRAIFLGRRFQRDQRVEILGLLLQLLIKNKIQRPLQFSKHRSAVCIIIYAELKCPHENMMNHKIWPILRFFVMFKKKTKSYKKKDRGCHLWEQISHSFLRHLVFL